MIRRSDDLTLYFLSTFGKAVISTEFLGVMAWVSGDSLLSLLKVQGLPPRDKSASAIAVGNLFFALELATFLTMGGGQYLTCQSKKAESCLLFAVTVTLEFANLAAVACLFMEKETLPKMMLSLAVGVVCLAGEFGVIKAYQKCKNIIASRNALVVVGSEPSDNHQSVALEVQSSR